MNVKGVGVQRFTSMAQLGEMIGRERKRQGITQEAAAGLCGVSIRLFVSTPADRV